MAIVILSGLITTFYQYKQKILTGNWIKYVILISVMIIISTMIAFFIYQ